MDDVIGKGLQLKIMEAREKFYDLGKNEKDELVDKKLRISSEL